jgi:hypothetical protein
MTPKKLTFIDKLIEMQNTLGALCIFSIILFFLLLFGDGKNLFVKSTDWVEAEAKNVVSKYTEGTKKKSKGTWQHSFYFEHPNGKQECSVSQTMCSQVKAVYYHQNHTNVYAIKDCNITIPFSLVIVLSLFMVGLWIYFWISFFRRKNFFFLLQYGETVSSKSNYLAFKSSIASSKTDRVTITMSLQSEFEYGTLSYCSMPHELQFAASKIENLSKELFISNKPKDNIIYESFMDNENIEVQNKASKIDETDILDKVQLPISIYKAANQLQKEQIPILFDPKNPNNNTILLKEDNTPKKINYLTRRNPAVERKKIIFLCLMFLSYLLPISVWLYYRYL